MVHRCRLEWRFNQQKEYLGWKTQDRVSNIARVHEGSELSNVFERRTRVPRCGDNDGILGNAGQAPIESIRQQLAASSRDRGAVLSSTLKQDSCGFKRNTRGRKFTVVKEPTQKNTADGFTKALQTATYLEWRNRLSTVLRRSKREGSTCGTRTIGTN